jgi:predicted enzyme related to lactoylglutathione lyase
MKKVTGIGGFFFKSENPANLRQWYHNHLGISSDEYGYVFEWRDIAESSKKGYTVWNPFEKDTNYFDPGNKQFMINYRVDNLVALIEELKKEGVQVVGEIEEFEYGKFGWILDPEGNKIELWEPFEKE